MIIYLFLCLYGCRAKTQTTTTIKNTYKQDRIDIEKGQESIDSAIRYYEGLPSSIEILNELSYLYWIKGLSLGNEEDWNMARFKGIQCLSYEEIFSMEYLHSMDLNWNINDQFWETEFQCNEASHFSIIGLPNEDVYLECATWTILSWSALISSYNLRYGSLDNAHILYLASWLFKHAKCLNSPWLDYAVALALSQAYHDDRTPFNHQLLKQRGFDLLQKLFTNPLIGDYVFLSHVGLQIELDMFPKESLDQTIQKLDDISSKPHTQKKALKLKERLRTLVSN